MLKTSLPSSEDAQQKSLDILDELEDLDAPYNNVDRMIMLLHYLYHTKVIGKQFGSGDIVNFIRENSNHHILQKLSFDKNFIEEIHKNGNPVYRTVSAIKIDKKFLVQGKGSRTLCFQSNRTTINRIYTGSNKPYNFNTTLKDSALHIAKQPITEVNYAENFSNEDYSLDDAEYIPRKNSSDSTSTPRRSSREARRSVAQDYAFFESSESDDLDESRSLSPTDFSSPCDPNEKKEGANTLLNLFESISPKEEEPSSPDLKTDEDLTDYFGYLDHLQNSPISFYQPTVNPQMKKSRKEPGSSIETTNSKRIKIFFS